MEPLGIVLGLGNPGERYRSTRHNLGFWVLDRLATRLGARFTSVSELAAHVAEIGRGSERLVLAKPRTYMNRSGRAALALCRRYDVTPPGLLVVHDDADLELGRLRIRLAGRAGGHNGVRSLIEALASEQFPRIKLGVRGSGREQRDLADYVLEPFEEEERATAEALADLAADALDATLGSGIEAAMNRFNGMRIGESQEEG